MNKKTLLRVSLVLLCLLLPAAVLVIRRPGLGWTVRKLFYVASWQVRVWTHQERPCNWHLDGADCPNTCPQGNFCFGVGGAWPDPDHAVCRCRSMWYPPCTTADDCDPLQTLPNGIRWTCVHYPGTSVGSCESRPANCHTTEDCAPIVGCAEGPACELYRWGDRGRCACAPKDGGAP